MHLDVNDTGSVCCAASGNSYATNVTIAGNKADGNGGGAYTTGGSVSRSWAAPRSPTTRRPAAGAACTTMPQMDRIELLQRIKRADPSLSLVHPDCPADRVQPGV